MLHKKPICLSDVLNVLKKVEKEKNRKVTLLGIGPMSRFIVRATLELAKEYNFPPMFIASRNQVESKELGGGYISGWDQKGLVEEIRKTANEVGFEGPIFICRDHGGPWLKDEEFAQKLSEEEAMDRAKASYLADIRAGFNVLHVDCTVDPHIEGYVPLEVVIKRTVELINYIEEHRKKEKIRKIGYEVGTEKTAGGLTEKKTFDKFLGNLIAELEKRSLPKPDFIVGQTGTLIKMQENVGGFDYTTASNLVAVAKKYKIGFKEHNADFLEDNVLKAHPTLGITAANTGPEFSVSEVKAYLKLADMEKRIAQEKGYPPSDFTFIFQKMAVRSRRWQKWLKENQIDLTEDRIMQDPTLIREITIVAGRYVLDEQTVREEKERMFENLKRWGVVDEPEKEIIENIKNSMLRWIEVFNLKDLTSDILTYLPNPKV